MSARLTIAVTDDKHNQAAEKLELEVWRVVTDSSGVQRHRIKKDFINEKGIIETPVIIDSFGAYEVILNTKGYYQRFSIQQQECTDMNVIQDKYVISIGVNELDKDYHLNIHITPTTYSATF
ncbi:unnamed protein product [Didymodactylos carnosus]|uniref:Transthyretin/hydroxyisourate hydrolase domain-containing protein n=1 Tax=Didymodactylos carnosus TaxID=1234261 RepID=A0A814DRU8_9BILA|nr:unnamed protein product [Didymodactylos carnosus]CAF1244974.1 unnamed protein product [Didymodactylos carnosus]CAF3735415.1 unnamed protein product [Didymodactylos carnosus]CAF4052509.1 unnamed protein product [Didymodactylos carnosus]